MDGNGTALMAPTLVAGVCLRSYSSDLQAPDTTLTVSSSTVTKLNVSVAQIGPQVPGGYTPSPAVFAGGAALSATEPPLAHDPSKVFMEGVGSSMLAGNVGDVGVAVTPAAPSRFSISVPTRVSSNGAFTLPVRVLDAYGNVVTDYAVQSILRVPMGWRRCLPTTPSWRPTAAYTPLPTPSN